MAKKVTREMLAAKLIKVMNLGYFYEGLEMPDGDWFADMAVNAGMTVDEAEELRVDDQWKMQVYFNAVVRNAIHAQEYLDGKRKLAGFNA